MSLILEQCIEFNEMRKISEFVNYRIDARIVCSKDVPKFKNTADYKKLAKEVLPTNGTIERGTNNIYIENL